VKIVVVNQKGGAGKSTVAMCLACAIAQSGVSVALKDADPQGSLKAWAIHVGGVPLLRERPDANVVIVDTAGQLDLENPRSRQTKELSEELESADKVILVTDLDFFSITAAVPMARFLKEHTSKGYVLFNKVQERTLIGSQDRSELASHLGLPALDNYLPFSAAYRNAAMQGWKAVTGKEREVVQNLTVELLSR
jgi:chromosome partitioning protein